MDLHQWLAHEPVNVLLGGTAGMLVLVGAVSYRLGRGRRGARLLEATIAATQRGQARSARAPIPAAPRTQRPIDLSRPIGAAEWGVLGRLRMDARYQRDLGIVRSRYQIVGNPMLLPNTIRETMDSFRVDLAEAISLIAQDERIR